MVKLISVTQGMGMQAELGPEDLIAYTARVSNPSNQMNTETGPKLLAYLIKHKHWSPFEMAHMTVEITTSRGIAAQILRHRSFSFQEFSQRYSQATNYVLYEPRRQDVKNKQNSIDDLPAEDMDWFLNAMIGVNTSSKALYEEALRRGVAKECARFLLPLNTETKLYMSGSVRSWVHYLQVRTEPGVQLEHRVIAEGIKKIFVERFPDTSKALEWV